MAKVGNATIRVKPSTATTIELAHDHVADAILKSDLGSYEGDIKEAAHALLLLAQAAKIEQDIRLNE